MNLGDGLVQRVLVHVQCGDACSTTKEIEAARSAKVSTGSGDYFDFIVEAGVGHDGRLKLETSDFGSLVS